MPREFEVSISGIRLDRFLVENLSGVGRRRARILCEQGLVLVNKKPSPCGRILKSGEKVSVLDLPLSGARPELALEHGGALAHISVIFEDEALLLISKPRGMHSITLKADDPLTVADCIAEYSPSCLTASADPREAGLVQRLDFYTSGLMLAAKTALVWKQLQRALFSGEIEKSYLAIVEGGNLSVPTEINYNLVQAASGKMMKISDDQNVEEKSFAAKTVIVECQSVDARNSKTKASVLRVFAHRARRHQIRVHLAAIGHPLVGDELYGAKSRLGDFIDSAKLDSVEPGFLLHADTIKFSHPRTKEKFNFSVEGGDIWKDLKIK